MKENQTRFYGFSASMLIAKTIVVLQKGRVEAPILLHWPVDLGSGAKMAALQ